MQYVDFDVRVRKTAAGEFRIRAESTTKGEADGGVSFSADGSEFAEDVARLQSRETSREFLQAFGARLYQKLFVGNIETLFQRSYGAVEDDERLGLRVRLRIEPPDLAVLPWELLYSSADRSYVGTRVITPLVRYLEMQTARRRLTTDFPLRLLVAIPTGDDSTAPLDTVAEKAVIESALAGMGDDVEIDYAHELCAGQRVTWEALYGLLGEKDYHCFHFIGHGAFQDDRGYLIIDAADSGVDYVDAERFSRLFDDSRSTKLVVLNACKGATTSDTRPFSGTAAQLVETGVPAVVAMQFNVFDKAAISFARTFYASLFRGGDRGRVDVAVSRSRRVLEATFGEQREFAAPVLFMRSPEGVLFVPESGSRFDDLPKSKDAIETLEAAADETAEENEKAVFLGRVRSARRIARTIVAIALVTLLLSWTRFLDIFTLDTRADLTIMAVGDTLSDHGVSEDLRIVAIDCNSTAARCGSIEATRGALADAVRRIGAARVIAIPAAFRTDTSGDFRDSPDSGRRLVAAIEASPASIVVGSLSRDDAGLQVPGSLRDAAAAAGHGCLETKLGFARSVPISVADPAAGRQWPSLSLASVAAFEGGVPLSIATEPAGEAIVKFSNRPDRAFAVSEIQRVETQQVDCSLIAAGSVSSQRFFRRLPEGILQSITLSGIELEQLAATDPEAVSREFDGKLVVLGLLASGQKINDLMGARDGLFVHADAINNLMVDDVIKPIRYGWQLVLMLALAAAAVFLRLRSGVGAHKSAAILAAASVGLIAASIAIYVAAGLLFNPAYHLMAVWVAWWIAGRAGRTWLGQTPQA